MGGGIPECIKYTIDELNEYKNTKGSCVHKFNAVLHLNILPFGLNDFNRSLYTLLSLNKVGTYNQKLKGIILDIHNIKLLGNSAAIRFDDPKIHLDIEADCYVFKPTIGAVVRGTVRHVSYSQLGVIIYRVFSVSIRLLNKPEVPIKVDSEIDFRVKKYCLENVFPYIEGELLEESSVSKFTQLKPKTETFEPDESGGLVRLLEEIKTEEVNTHAE